MTEDWSGERVARWIRQSQGLERQLAPVSEVLFAAADLQQGERVLDIGCGTGPTTRRAAALVGPHGDVTGLDVAVEMLEAARTTAPERGSAPIEWLAADAARWEPSRSYDAVISRFGVMFFSDPVAAFRTLARASSRLAVAVWARRDESDLFRVPLRAALGVVGENADLPDDAGPFSLHAPRPLLEAAGWGDVEVVRRTLMLPFAGGLSPEAAAVAALDFGPVRTITTDLDERSRDAVKAAIAQAFEGHVDAGGHVVLSGQVNVVTASAAEPPEGPRQAPGHR